MNQEKRTKIIEKACRIVMEKGVTFHGGKATVDPENLEEVRRTISHYKYKHGIDITHIMRLHHIWATTDTGYTGVIKYKNKYKAQKTINGKTYYIGIYATPEQAYEAFKNFKL